MNFLPFTIFAYLLNAVAVTADKFLLNKYIPNPIIYVFYISLISLVALIPIPFTHIPTINVFLLANISTILWTFGAYFMFCALKVGQVSRVIPIIGTLTPLFLLIHAAIYGTIDLNQIWASGFLILGLILITLTNWKGKLQLKELVFEFGASALFAISYLLLREAYLKTDFLTVFAWSKICLLPLLIALPFIKSRPQSLRPLFFAGQLAGGTSQLLLTFSISLATPALVNSLQGIQYVFLLIFSLFLSKRYPQVFAEKSSRLIFISKVTGIMFIFLGLFILSFQGKQKEHQFGVSYSPMYASQLGLDPKTTFTKMLDELGVKLVRLPVYWNEIEQFPNQINFSSIDYYLQEAQKRNVKIILVLGYKQPRWPECFDPYWVRHTTYDKRQEKILSLVEKEIDHFKNFPTVSGWQIENEPFFNFGFCDKVIDQTKKLLQKEVEIVKSKDSRPVLITDSGELSNWIEASKIGDIFGFSLYRQVWGPYFGTQKYPLPPIFYTLKADLVRLLIQNPNKKFIVSELQTEPWIPNYKDPLQMTPGEQAKILTVSDLASNIEFAKQTGASQSILWGVEWWYFMANNNHPEYLQYAKQLF